MATKYYGQTVVAPRPHHRAVYDVQAITFSYFGVVHSINRRGNRKIHEFIGADGTFTLTNGVDKFLRMNPHGVLVQSITHNDGTLETFKQPPTE